MTKQDYIKIANVINELPITRVHEIYYEHILKNDLIDELCKMFKKDNSTFNEKTFKEYTK